MLASELCVLIIDVTMYEYDSSDNVSCCSEVTKGDRVGPATVVRGKGMFSCGFTKHEFLFLSLTQNNTFCCSAPYNKWPQTKVVSYSVLWKGQWSCDVDHSVLSLLRSVRYGVQAGSTVLSILSNCDLFRWNNKTFTEPAFAWIICNWFHWAHCVGEC